MLINGVNISQYNASQHTMQIGRTEISNDSKWLPGAAIPYFKKSITGFKTLVLALVIKGNSRNEILSNASKIEAACLDTVTIKLDNYPNDFVGVLKSEPKYSETAMRHWHKMELSFVGYERGTEKSTTMTGTSAVVNNAGTAISPAKITITAKQNINNMAITGISRDKRTRELSQITIPNLLSGHTLIIDGYTGLITDNGSAKDITCKYLPTLAPGNNTIAVNKDSSYCTVKIDSYPVYM